MKVHISGAHVVVIMEDEGAIALGVSKLKSAKVSDVKVAIWNAIMDALDSNFVDGSTLRSVSFFRKWGEEYMDGNVERLLSLSVDELREEWEKLRKENTNNA